MSSLTMMMQRYGLRVSEWSRDVHKAYPDIIVWLTNASSKYVGRSDKQVNDKPAWFQLELRSCMRNKWSARAKRQHHWLLWVPSGTAAGGAGESFADRRPFKFVNRWTPGETVTRSPSASKSTSKVLSSFVCTTTPSKLPPTSKSTEHRVPTGRVERPIGKIEDESAVIFA